MYDAQKDADQYLKKLNKWAYLGFLRGFAGLKKAALPRGEMVLPSKAFFDVAEENLKKNKDNVEDYAERRAYVDNVEALLRKKQSFYIKKHYRNFVIGYVGDIAMALFVMSLMAALMFKFGPLSPVTLVLMSMLASMLLFLQYSVRRAIRIGQEAFRVKKEDIKLPWE